jgi:hypothetical protein
MDGRCLGDGRLRRRLRDERRRRLGRGAEQHARHRLHRRRDRVEIVTALEANEQPAARERREHCSHVRKAARRDVAAAERVARARIEAGRDDDELGCELVGDRQDEPLEGGYVVTVADA